MNSETSTPAASARTETMSPSKPGAQKISEDKRRPLALRPYLILWACCLSCVVFALISLFMGL